MSAKEVIDTSNNFPHIIRLIDGDEEIADKFFVAVEQELVVKCARISTAILLLLSMHYIFNIEYNVKVHDVLTFFQEYMLGLGSESRKSAAYLNFTHIEGTRL